MIITLQNSNQNVSLQVGDTVWSVPYLIGPQNADNENIFADGAPEQIGDIISINGDDIEVLDGASVPQPGNGDFLMFSKDKRVNNTSLVGYYAEVKLKNDSKGKAELFALSSEVAESSK